MWNYLALTISPDGYGIMNNDADKIYNRGYVLEAASLYNRDDWKYIASNGETGTKPKEGPSYIFPWAGQMVSRSGYDKEAQWSFFDIGPWGTGHQHNDKLHISISAFGSDFLVDCGRFAYKGAVADKFRKYAVGSQSHNIILIDGNGQAHGPALAQAPLPENQFKITDDFDYACGSFNQFTGLVGTANHTRAIFYVRGNFWVVADQITTDKPRKIEALWHWHPQCTVKVENGNVTSAQNGKGYLSIIPVSSQKWNVSILKGQEKPEIQGWYSKEYNTYEPNSTTIYSTKIDTNETLVWVLLPSGQTPSAIRAEILSQNSSGVRVKVSLPGKGIWNITVPFSNSSEASMNFVSDEKK